MKVLPAIILLLPILTLVAQSPVAAEVSVTSEYKLLAAFTLSVAKYATWKAKSSFNDPKSPLRIDVIENPELLEALKGISASKSVGDHPVEILSTGYTELTVLLKTKDQKAQCAELIVIVPKKSDPEYANHLSLLEKLKGCNCLTVTYEAGKVAAESVVNFYRKDDHLRFQISSKRAQEEGLELSSQLLKLATPPE